MVETVEVAALPLAPRNPLPRLQQMKAARAFHTGCEALRDAGGPVTRLALAWPLPPVVVTTSPMGARDVLSRSYPFVDRTQPLFDRALEAPNMPLSEIDMLSNADRTELDTFSSGAPIHA